MSKIKVNTIAPRSGTTVTLGEAGDTVALGACASQTGFGRTGTVDWCTTAKTSPLTAVSGKGYFVNTCGGAVTVTLPASPSAGDIVAVSDYAQTAACNAITIGRNSKNIDGTAVDLTLDTKGIATTLVYVDTTKGWKPVNSNEVTNSLSFVTASGGTETTSGDYKIHTFNADGPFNVTCAGSAAGSDKVSYMVVAGGASGGADGGGGGGAGGYREGKCTSDPYTASPLNAPDGLAVSVQNYTITVGGGGTAHSSPPWSSHPAGQGANSVFSTITSAGGGAGTANAGTNGGSGAGGGRGSPMAAGSGNTPPVSPPQGNNGGAGSPGGNGSGGAGGATAAGTATAVASGGAGGAGATSSINATPTARAGGGGGGATSPHSDPGGAGGAGGGGAGAGCGSGGGTAGTTNTGGGGGGGTGSVSPVASGAGGSGVVIIRYKYQ
jgi:hypothetical protein